MANKSAVKLKQIILKKTQLDLKPAHSNSLNLIQRRKNQFDQILNNKPLRLHNQKLKMEISLHLKSNYNQEMHAKTTQSQSLTKYDSKLISLKQKNIQNQLDYDNIFIMRRPKRRSMGGNDISNKNNLSQNLYRKRKQIRQSRLIASRKKSINRQKQMEQKQKQIRQMHKKSFTIKQIKPEKKLRFNKEPLISNSMFGKTYGSYYQIVAIQKKFQNSRYFFDHKSNEMMCGGRNDFLLQRYYSRISNPELYQKERGSKVHFGPYKYEGEIIEPWKSHEDEDVQH